MAVHGAALHKRIEKQLREYLHAYLVEEGAYKCRVRPVHPEMPETVFYAEFTQARNGKKIFIDQVFVDNDGTILQHNHAQLS
jgi:hypothetical protein